MAIFKPRRYFKNNHIQTVFSSTPIRKQIVKKQAREFLDASEQILVKTSKGIKLHVDITRASDNNHPNGRKMVILFHGWEGSSHSPYVLSLGQQLWDQGYCVARMNLRDHGDTHHLNQKPFNSVRLQELTDAITNLSKRYHSESIILAGFSLGGNFVLRLTAHEKIQALNLCHSFAICPVLDPVHVSDTLVHGPQLYHQYFVKKWRHSLNQKYRYYPEVMNTTEHLKSRSLNEMNAVFVPEHTAYTHAEKYLSAYAITQQTLNTINSDCHIIYADDDPIIDAADFDQLSETPWVKIDAQLYGGHCAFMEGFQGHSWVNRHITELLCDSDNTITG